MVYQSQESKGRHLQSKGERERSYHWDPGGSTSDNALDGNRQHELNSPSMETILMAELERLER